MPDAFVLGMIFSLTALAFNRLGKRESGMSRGAAGSRGANGEAGPGLGSVSCCAGCGTDASELPPTPTAQDPSAPKSWAPAGWSSSQLEDMRTPAVFNNVTAEFEGGGFGN